MTIMLYFTISASTDNHPLKFVEDPCACPPVQISKKATCGIDLGSDMKARSGYEGLPQWSMKKHALMGCRVAI